MQPQQQQQPQVLSGNTMYKDLPQNYRKVIDAIHENMMKHRRTMQNIKTMAPALLTLPKQSKDSTNTRPYSSPADAAAGPTSLSGFNNHGGVDHNVTPLPMQINKLQSQIQTLSSQIEESIGTAQNIENIAKRATGNVIMHLQWPLENLAVRRNVATTFRRPYSNSLNANSEEKKEGTNSSAIVANGSTITNTQQTNLEQKVARMLDLQAADVDRVEKMPSPYIWEQLQFFQQTLSQLQHNIHTLKDQLVVANASKSSSSTKGLESVQEIAQIVRSQHDAFIRIAGGFANIHDRLEAKKARFLHMHQSKLSYYSKNAYADPFLAADIKEAEEERKLREMVQAKVAAVAAASAPAAPAPGIVPTAPAPAISSGLFGSTTTSGTSSLFGATPAPAPTTGGLFGSTPVPASGGLFGSTPAPAPATGSLFGSTPAPATAAGGLFGSTTSAPAPAAGGLFGSTTPAPAAGGIFGSTAPAPAPAAGGLFGSAPAPTTASTTSAFGAPAPGPAGLIAGAPSAGLFGAPAPAASFGSSKSKSKSRSGRSRR